ncbi:MAG: DUF1801 domain-containing protein [Gemmataceae bacterium]
MAAKKAAPETLEALLASLDHPLKAEIHAVRRIILEADPSISEGVKWNAPSFRTSGWFATVHLRATDCVQVILHLGAKARSGSGVVVDDPESLLEWLGKDRASVRFTDAEDVEGNRAAFADLIRRWIKHV